MNGPTSSDLKRIVERAVRPIESSTAHKKKLREELLGHVTGVFEEEFSRTSDEPRALNLTEQRFGDPRELAVKLQESVPRADRFLRFMEWLIEPRTGERLVRRAVRYAMTMFAVFALHSIALTLVIFPLIGKADRLGMVVYLMLLIATATGWATFMSTLLTIELRRALFCDNARSYGRALLAGLISTLGPVSLPLMIALGMTPFFAAGDPIVDPHSLWAVLPATFLFPLVLIGTAKLTADDMRYHEEWARIEVE